MVAMKAVPKVEMVAVSMAMKTVETRAGQMAPPTVARMAGMTVAS